MGLFDRIFNSNAGIIYKPNNDKEAWVAILYACMSVDGEVSNIEIDNMVKSLVFKQKFQNVQIIDYYKPAMVAQNKIGSKAIIDSSISLILNEDKPTLFCLVMELLLADGHLGDKEKEIAEYLTSLLELDISVATSIVEVMLIKNKGNVIL